MDLLDEHQGHTCFFWWDVKRDLTLLTYVFQSCMEILLSLIGSDLTVFLCTYCIFITTYLNPSTGHKSLIYSPLQWNQNMQIHFTFSFPHTSDWSFTRPLRYVLVPLSSATHLREGGVMSSPTQNRKAVWWISPIEMAVCLRAIWHQGDWLNPRLVHSCSFYLWVFFGLCKMCLWCMFSTFPVRRDGLNTVNSVELESFLKCILEAITEALFRRCDI